MERPLRSRNYGIMDIGGHKMHGLPEIDAELVPLRDLLLYVAEHCNPVMWGLQCNGYYLDEADLMKLYKKLVGKTMPYYYADRTRRN